MTDTTAHKTASLRIWLLAARPKTLPASLVPALAGGAIACAERVFHLWSFLAAVFGAVMIQIGANYANDLFDYLKRTDTTERIGPTRATQAGLVTPRQMAFATAIVFSLATLAGVYLVYRGGWPIVIIGLSSIACGILYTAGPMALGYIGLADLFVLVFFGPVALAGTYYVQALTVTRPIIIAGFAFGMISVAILTVNNLRDIETDRKGGKNSLPVRFGPKFARIEYVIMLLGAAAVALVLAATERKPFLLLTFLYLPLAIAPVKAVFTKTDGETLNNTLAVTGRLLLAYGILFSVGWAL
ncbi:MAG: 1,4-dihydroxy-2-naphthoate polyprenyltransferase [candidate division Zixibacteria bacterium]|nr:1,4-dihydroxy-2-naphthoate polyprenyltransferase [candidate division Zixibacteria bacterium]